MNSDILRDKAEYLMSLISHFAERNAGNFLLMHAMGPNVAGVIGSAVAAGILLSFLG